MHHPEKPDASGELRPHDYTAKLWLRGDSRETLIREYRELAMFLKLGVDEKTPDTLVVKTIKEFLSAHPGWLLVIDNADDTSIANLLPTQGGDVLITSRQPSWQGVKVEVDVLEPDEAMQFYLKLSGVMKDTPGNDADTIKALVDVLGHLPLAIAQAAAYVKNNGINTKEYLQSFNTYQESVLRRNALPASTQEERNRLTIMTTWNLSLDAVEKRHALEDADLPFCAKELLTTCAYLASADIPKSLLQHWVTGHSPQAPHTLTLNKALEELWSHSLIQRDPEHIHVHKLLQEVIRIQNPLDKTRFEAIGNALAEQGRPEAHRQMDEINRIIKLIPHGQSLLTHHDKASPPLPLTAALLNLLDCLQHNYSEQGNAHARKDTLQRILLINEKIYGKEHVEVANTLGNLSSALGELGDAQGARNMLERALKIFEAHYGPEHVEVAKTLGNLAGALMILGDMQNARSMLERALTIQERHYGKEHVEVASTLVNLANALSALENAQGARPMYGRALTIQERHYGKEHVEVAKTLGNFANALSALEDAKGARSMYERALTIQERYYGPEHVKVANTLGNLAIALMTLRDAQGACNMHERALTIKERYYGPEHVQVAMTLNNLANALGSLGDGQGARSMYERTLKIKEDHYGAEHVEVARTKANLAMAQAKLGNKVDAQRLIAQSITMVANFPGYGSAHPLYPQMQGMQRSIEQYNPATGSASNAPAKLDALVAPLLQAAQAQSQQGKHETALAHYWQLREVIEARAPQSTAHANLLLHMGTAYHRAGQTSEAIDCLGQGLGLSVKLDASNAGAHALSATSSTAAPVVAAAPHATGGQPHHAETLMLTRLKNGGYHAAAKVLENINSALEGASNQHQQALDSDLATITLLLDGDENVNETVLIEILQNRLGDISNTNTGLHP